MRRGFQVLLQRSLQAGAVKEAAASLRAAGGEAAAACRHVARTTVAPTAFRSFAAATQQAWRTGVHQQATLQFAAVHLPKAGLRQYGFAAGGALRAASRTAGGATRTAAHALRQPVGMAGSSLGRAACRRMFSEMKPVNPAEAYGPAALTAGLTSGQRKAIAAWLALCSGWVAVLVVVGGITRLTRSGLSMTSWKFTGEKPPSTPEEWEEEFARYKLTPEYIKTNQGMTVEEFKFIYFWEWGHRMWGRALGLVVAVPAAVFASRGMVNRALGRRLSLLFLMGATQGLVGWWMVRSGFQEPEDNQVPRVSTYRMAGHLLSAFVIFSTLVWTTLSVAIPAPPLESLGPEAARAGRLLGRWVHPVAGIVAITAMSGCFVAGKDAGRAYNTWPDMNGEWIPSEYWSERLPALRNIFENTAAVQFNHRMLAYTTLGSIAGLWRYGTQLKALPPCTRLVLHALLAATGAQVALGITTLLTYVPVPLGAAHQGTAMVLFTLMLGLMYSIKQAPSLGTFRLLMHKYAAPVAAASVVGVGGTVMNMT